MRVPQMPGNSPEKGARNTEPHKASMSRVHMEDHLSSPIQYLYRVNQNKKHLEGVPADPVTEARVEVSHRILTTIQKYTSARLKISINEE